MTDAPKPEPANEGLPGRIWTGTGLCCESQGDGVPCSGTAGECETCGRALPLPQEAPRPTQQPAVDSW